MSIKINDFIHEDRKTWPENNSVCIFIINEWCYCYRFLIFKSKYDDDCGDRYQYYVINQNGTIFNDGVPFKYNFINNYVKWFYAPKLENIK